MDSVSSVFSRSRNTPISESLDGETSRIFSGELSRHGVCPLNGVALNDTPTSGIAGSSKLHGFILAWSPMWSQSPEVSPFFSAIRRRNFRLPTKFLTADGTVKRNSERQFVPEADHLFCLAHALARSPMSAHAVHNESSTNIGFEMGKPAGKPPSLLCEGNRLKMLPRNLRGIEVRWTGSRRLLPGSSRKPR